MVRRLRDVRGGDDARIDVMTGPLGVKLVGRSPLPARAADFLRAVLSARGTPLPQPLPAAPGSGPCAPRCCTPVTHTPWSG